MPRTAPVLLLLAYLAFISLGLPDTVLGVAWPSLRKGFELSQSAMTAVLGAGLAGYFSSGLLAGATVARFGVGGLLSASSALVAAALVGYSLAPSWFFFFPMGVLMGLGSGAIDSGLNGYAARHFSVRHVNWLHAFWGVGASIGPMLMTFAIARGHGYRAGYASLAVVLGTMAGLFLLTRRRWDSPPSTASASAAASAASESAVSPASAEASGRARDAPAGFRTALASRRVWLLIGTFFLYTGLESSVGQWCFSWMRERRGASVESAGAWTSAYWASLTIGRIVLGTVIDGVGPDRLLRCATGAAVAGAASFVGSGGALGHAGLLLLGLSLAPMFPTLMARTPARVGEHVAHHAVGFQVSAATLGSALMPGFAGVVASAFGLGAIALVILALGVALLLIHEVLLRAGDLRAE